MMDYVAQRGYDVYLVDVRGYSGSTKPPEMDAPPADNKPIVDTSTAARDVAAAVDHILQKRGISKIDLMGWSWGTAIMGLYTTTHNDKVNRLVLYAPAWTFTTRPAVGGGDAPLGAYRTVSKDSAKQRWLNGVPEAKKAELIPDGWFEQWADATWALDPAGEKQTPPVLRAPNGVLQDFRSYWIAGKPQYDPADASPPSSSMPSGTPTCRAIRRAATSPTDQRALQALRRNRRRHALDHDGKEPHAVLPRDYEFPRRA